MAELLNDIKIPPPSPPTSLYSASCLSTMKCYYRRLSFTQPWGLFGIAPPLSDPPPFFQHGSRWTRSSVLCNQRDTYWVWLDAHQFSNNIISVWFGACKYHAPSGKARIISAFTHWLLENKHVSQDKCKHNIFFFHLLCMYLGKHACQFMYTEYSWSIRWLFH